MKFLKKKKIQFCMANDLIEIKADENEDDNVKKEILIVDMNNNIEDAEEEDIGKINE